jgi:hypothetical protein
MPYLVTVWEEDGHKDSEQYHSEVGDTEGELFSQIVDLEAELAEGQIQAFKVQKVE